MNEASRAEEVCKWNLLLWLVAIGTLRKIYVIEISSISWYDLFRAELFEWLLYDIYFISVLLIRRDLSVSSQERGFTKLLVPAGRRETEL